MLERMWKKGTLTHYWRGYKLMQPLWKMVWKFLKILKIRLPYMCAKSSWSCPVACHAPLSIGFSRWKYWSRLPCLPPWDLPNPRIKPMSLTSSALAGGFFTTMPPKWGWSIILTGLQGWKDTLGVTTSEQGQDFNEVKGLLETLSREGDGTPL